MFVKSETFNVLEKKKGNEKINFCFSIRNIMATDHDNTSA